MMERRLLSRDASLTPPHVLDLLYQEAVSERLRAESLTMAIELQVERGGLGTRHSALGLGAVPSPARY